ncbi:hypothetical protein BJ741DRAFT_636284 [Chytriomyces cf. hyalinus JEL632]|nr:hypothetical protein BJ741DRAFT_636284 [Chytriomyces cf. hyalinus JEL632]
MLSMNNTSTTRIKTKSLSKCPPTILGSSATDGLPFLDSSLLPLSQLSPLKQTPYSVAFDSLQSPANDSLNRPQSSSALSMHSNTSMSIAPARRNSPRRSTALTSDPSSISISSLKRRSSTNGATPAAPLDFIGAASVGNQHSELFYFDHNQMITEDSIFPGIGALDFESMFANDRAEQAYHPFDVRVSAPSKPPMVDVFGGANVDETSGQLDLMTFSFDSSHDFDYPITAGSSAALTQGRISNAPSISNTLNARSNLYQTENGRNAILPPTQQPDILPPIVSIHEDRRTNTNSASLAAGAGLHNGSSATVSKSQRHRIDESKTPISNLSESVIAAPDVKQSEKILAFRVAPLSPPTLPKLKLRLRTGKAVVSSSSEILTKEKKTDDQKAAAAGIQSVTVANQKEIIGSNAIALNTHESRILQPNPTIQSVQENAGALPEKHFVASQAATAMATIITPGAATVHESAPIHHLAVMPSIIPAGITQKPIIASESTTTKHDPHPTHVSQDLKKAESSPANLPIEPKPSEKAQPIPAKEPIPTPPLVADVTAVVPQNESQGKRAKREKRQIWAWVPVIPAEVKPVDLSAGRSLRTRTSDAHERASARTEGDGIEAGRKAKRRKSELPVVSEVRVAEVKVESAIMGKIEPSPVSIIPDVQLPQVSIAAVAQLPKAVSLSMSEGQNTLTPSEVKQNEMPTPIAVDTVPNAPVKPVEIAAKSILVIDPPAAIPAEAPKRSGVCHSCKTPGKLLDCTACLLSYHFTCVEEGLEKNLEAQKKYICNRCQFMQEDDIIPEQPPHTQLPQSNHILAGISAAMAQLKDSGALRAAHRPKGRLGRPPKSQKLKLPKPVAPTALSAIPTAIAPLIATNKDPSSLPVVAPPIPKLRVRLTVRPAGSFNLSNAFESEPRPEPGSLPVNTVYRITESKIKRDFFAKVRANNSSNVSVKAMSLERYKMLLELERNAHKSA